MKAAKPKLVLSAILALSVFLIVVIAVRHELKRHELKRQAQQKREAYYQSVLNSYVQFLKPGMTRRKVEDYLRTNNKEFRQTCCVDFRESSTRHSWDDLVKIAEEEVPIACGENNVYVALQFIDHSSDGQTMQSDDLDILRTVAIYHQLEKCL